MLERTVAYEPGYIEGVYSSEERAKASQPGVEWARGDDGSLYQHVDESHLSPHGRGLGDSWQITAFEVDATP